MDDIVFFSGRVALIAAKFANIWKAQRTSIPLITATFVGLAKTAYNYWRVALSFTTFSKEEYLDSFLGPFLEKSFQVRSLQETLKKANYRTPAKWRR